MQTSNSQQCWENRFCSLSIFPHVSLPLIPHGSFGRSWELPIFTSLSWDCRIAFVVQQTDVDRCTMHLTLTCEWRDVPSEFADLIWCRKIYGNHIFYSGLPRTLTYSFFLCNTWNKSIQIFIQVFVYQTYSRNKKYTWYQYKLLFIRVWKKLLIYCCVWNAWHCGDLMLIATKMRGCQI
jgi:hypothetical protein